MYILFSRQISFRLAFLSTVLIIKVYAASFIAVCIILQMFLNFVFLNMLARANKLGVTNSA